MRTSRIFVILGLGIWLFLSGLAVAEAEEPTSNVHFSVIRDYNGKPVRNASVILHPLTRKGQQAYSGLQLKTDAEGNTNFDGVPFGKLRIQVLAQGFQTYGEDFDIDKPDMQITIKLKRPVEQYSVYGSKPKTDANQGKNATPDADAAKPDAAGDAKAEAKSDGQSGAKSDPPKSDKPQQ